MPDYTQDSRQIGGFYDDSPAHAGLDAVSSNPKPRNWLMIDVTGLVVIIMLICAYFLFFNNASGQSALGSSKTTNVSATTVGKTLSFSAPDAALSLQYPASWNAFYSSDDNTGAGIAIHPIAVSSTPYTVSMLITSLPFPNSNSAETYYLDVNTSLGLIYSSGGPTISRSNVIISGHSAMRITDTFSNGAEFLYEFINATSSLPHYYIIEYMAVNQSDYVVYLPDAQETINSIKIG